MRWKNRVLGVTFVLLAAATASLAADAESSKWQFDVFPYGWLAGNYGTVTVENYSSITGNGAADFGPDVYNLGPLYLDGTSTIGVLDGYSAIGVSPVLSIKSRSSTAHQLVLSWSDGYQLLSATNVSGPYQPVPEATSPYTVNMAAAPQQFYKLADQ